MASLIAYLASYQIDKSKWDQCIAKSSSSNIYASSLYLDTMADHWQGLVINDYDAVMPLPWRRKIGIRYYYTPAFVQQLGLFGNAVNDQNIIKTIQAFASYGDYMLNEENHISTLNDLESCTNLTIDLSVKYDTIYNNYTKDLIRNLKKAAKESFTYKEDESIESNIRLYQSMYAQRTVHVKEKDYQHFIQLCQLLKKKGQCLTRKVTDSSGNLLAVMLLLKDTHRLYNVINITTEAGRRRKANHFLMDRIINEFAGTALYFDFEGSDLPGVKSFYETFSAVNQPYYHWHFNKLPWPLRLLKE
jgi:hypothetical protein